MNRGAYWQITENSMEPHMRERSIEYLTKHLRSFLKKRERVLICFVKREEGSLGWLMEQAVLRCDAVPVIWGPDRRWKTLLQQAFYSHAGVIIAPPLITLGLAKLKKYNGIPLYIRHAVMAGYPCPDWMIDGITGGLDCRCWGSFGIGESGVIAGFSCGHSDGIHLRDDEYGVEIVDTDGKALPDGELGEMVLYHKAHPELRYSTGENGRIAVAPCKCGCTSPVLVDMDLGRNEDPDLAKLGQQLQSWTSVLDCKINKGQYGLELEMVVFAGEKLPVLPSAAKRVIRPWDPKHDEPIHYIPTVNYSDF